MNRRLPALLLLAGLAAAAAPASAQFMYFPYFGKNRINFERFAWKAYPTEHFKIYFYTDDPRLLKNAADTAESAYLKVSADLRHQLAEPVPLLYFTTVTDFEQSNVFQASEGILGMAEPILFRIGIHGDMPIDALQELITHELTHIFEFDILWGHQGGALTAVSQPPLWTFEGLSEYATGRWSSWSELIVRDAVLNDRMPELDETGDLVARYPTPREPAYDFGHALYEFLVERYGGGAIRDLWQTLKGSAALSRRDPFKRTFGVPARQIGQELKRWLRARAKDFAGRENPEDYSLVLGPEYPANPYYFAFSHALSPSGDVVATISYNAKTYDMDVVLASVKDGKVLRNITAGFTTSYEYIKYDIDPANGPALAWSPEGDRIAFFARRGRRHGLFIVSPVTGRILQTHRLELDQPAGLRFHPDGRSVVFAAFRKGIRDLFQMDLATGAVTPLTDDPLYEKAPAFSPDGRILAYTLRTGAVDKIFLSPLADMAARTQLTFGPDEAIDPAFSPDGKTLYFASNARGAFNICSISLETGEIRRHTDVRTGNFLPAALASEPGRVLFSSFNKGSFQLFKAEAAGPVIGRTSLAAAPAAPAETFVPAVDAAVDPAKIEARQGLGKLYVTSRPPVNAIVSTDGSIYGGGSLAFSDILGNRQFSVSAYQVREMRSTAFAYLNRTGRLQWAASVFQYGIYYYPDLYYYDPSLWHRATYADAAATRRITGAQAAFYYPLSLYVRLEGGLGLLHYEEEILDSYGAGRTGYGSVGFLNGTMASAELSLIGETTRFRPYGPAQGHTFRLSLAQALPVAESFIRNTRFEGDLRKYFYVGSEILLALRLQGRLSRGRDPFLFYYGGNNEVRSATYYSMTATEYWIANAELRFPIASLAQTLLGTLGPIRGVIFFDVTRSHLPGYTSDYYIYDPDYTDGEVPYYRKAQAIGSFGAGLELFLLGYPVHFEWVKQLQWEDFGKPLSITPVGAYKLKFWIGFDF